MGSSSEGGPALRLFSYLPNPRLAKAQIAAVLCGLELEIRGAAPQELPGWLWDFDARPLEEGEKERGQHVRQARAGFSGALHKTDAFLEANPFGTVPCAFSADGRTGFFESNSILRAVARAGREARNLYGADDLEASRIDSFLDVSLVFARESQRYLLALGHKQLDARAHDEARHAFDTYLGGMDQALRSGRRFLVGESLSLADITFACEMALFSGERASGAFLAEKELPRLFEPASLNERFPSAMAHYDRLCAEPVFAKELGPYLEKIASRA